MKFAPRHSQIIGRMVVKREKSTIIRPTETKTSVFVLVDAVGPEAASAGIKPGDVVVPLMMGHVILENAKRPFLEEKNIGFFVSGVSLSELLVQNEKGDAFVTFDEEEAAKSLGVADENEAKAAE